MSNKRLGFYGKGITKTPSGHLRYTSPKHLRNKLVHRAMVEKLLEETPFSVRQMIPWPYEVHHMDFQKEHNCAANFLLLSPEFHSWVTMSGQKRIDGRFSSFVPRWQPAPEWKLFDDSIDEVPF